MDTSSIAPIVFWTSFGLGTLWVVKTFAKFRGNKKTLSKTDPAATTPDDPPNGGGNPTPNETYWQKRQKNLIAWFEKKTVEVEAKPHLLAFPFLFIITYGCIGLALKYNAPQFYEPWNNNPVLFWFWIPLIVFLTSLVKELENKILTGMIKVALFICIATGYWRYSQASSWNKWWGTMESWVSNPEAEQRRLDDPERTPIRKVIAKPGVWSESVPIPPKYDLIYREYGKIMVEISYKTYKDGEESTHTRQFEDSPGHLKPWLDENVFSFRFMSLENHDVEIEVNRYRTPEAQRSKK